MQNLHITFIDFAFEKGILIFEFDIYRLFRKQGSGNGQFAASRKGGYEYGSVEANAFMNRIISCLLEIPTDGLGNSQTGRAGMRLICSLSQFYR